MKFNNKKINFSANFNLSSKSTNLNFKNTSIRMKSSKKKKNFLNNKNHPANKQKTEIFFSIYRYFFYYPTSMNLTTNWNWGFLAFCFLMIQIITGFLLSTHYVPTTEGAFWSVNKVIMRDIPYGNMLRYFHSNGASFFFGIVYIHIARAFYNFSYTPTKRATWLVGVLIYLAMCFTAFTGYVLPWGQMSYWAAMVITSLTSATPIIGSFINVWVWGNFSVNTETLHRFYSLHYGTPFVILILVIAHVIFLHKRGSSSRLKRYLTRSDKVNFAQFFLLKDWCSLLIVLIIFFIWVSWKPNALGHPDNYVEANPLVTPEHIVPEWYFLPYYAMLRSVPNKILGIIILISAILILLIFPFFISKKFILPITKKLDKQASFNLDNKFNRSKLTFFGKFKWTIWRLRMVYLFWIFISDFILLGKIGARPVEYPYDKVGLILTITYFLYFILLIILFEEKVIDRDELWQDLNEIEKIEYEKEQELINKPKIKLFKEFFFFKK